MSAVAQLRTVYRELGVPERIFCVLFPVWLLFYLVSPSGGLRPYLQLGTYFFGGWCAIRWTRRAIRKTIWWLRNRLVVAFLFIAGVPILMGAMLAGLGVWALAHQLGIYLVTSEFNRRVAAIEDGVQSLQRSDPAERAQAVRKLGELLSQRFPGFEVVARGLGEWRYPAGSALTEPPAGWGNASGVVIKDGFFYAWAHVRREDLAVTALAPVTRMFLSDLAPGLGEISLISLGVAPTGGRPPRMMRSRLSAAQGTPDGSAASVPSPVNPLDLEVWWAAPIPASFWESRATSEVLLGIHSRIFAVLRVFFSQKVDWDQGLLLYILYGVSILFFIVEAVSVAVGVSITRTVTGAVHDLYEGTMRITQGDFSHRIQIKGNDQVADLSRTFNRMTENLERLLAVAKESERLQAELEIAREVQAQLYPRQLPSVEGLQLTSRWQPARTVSGDYFDYQALDANRLAIAIGDVAGKGISAALLMATVQSCFRTQIRYCLEAAAAAGSGSRLSVSTAGLVAQLNQQLHTFTTPEKFATFFFGVFDKTTGQFTYTNAGHLPPILLRNGEARRLEVNGMVVGAFPFADYDDSRVDLLTGDMLIFFTDGITEPQNEYGEMFGEERLIDIVAKYERSESEAIISKVLESVQEWTGSPDLQDDMTLLLARRQ